MSIKTLVERKKFEFDLSTYSIVFITESLPLKVQLPSSTLEAKRLSWGAPRSCHEFWPIFCSLSQLSADGTNQFETIRFSSYIMI